MEECGEEHSCKGPMFQGGVQGAGGSCPGLLCPGDWGSRGLGTGLLATGLPHPILILLLPPGDVNNQFSWRQEEIDGKALVICRALF